jgi:hypothetical protein
LHQPVEDAIDAVDCFATAVQLLPPSPAAA